MNADDILAAISKNLSELKSSAALSNYKVLCNKIGHINELLEQAISRLDGVVDTIQTEF